jgi:gluconate/galactonate dehydratase
MLETKKMGDLAATYYIPLALHNVASPIGTMASAHVAAACKNFLAMEYHARDVDWWGDLVGESMIVPANLRFALSD